MYTAYLHQTPRFTSEWLVLCSLLESYRVQISTRHLLSRVSSSFPHSVPENTGNTSK